MTFTQSITNIAYTSNNAISNKSSLSACLDLFSMGVSASDKHSLIKAALLEDLPLAVKTVMYLRDPRNSGQGNRDIARAFHSVVQSLLVDQAFKRAYLELLTHLPEMSSWKDLYELYDTANSDVKATILQIVTKALQAEDRLANKWFPRQSQVHHDIADLWGQPVGFIRKYVAHHSRTVEQFMCHKLWDRIDYSSIPSRANLVYSKAFLRNDSERRQQFLSDAIAGKVKANSSVLYPHEVLKQVWEDADTAEALWKNLPSYSSNINILPVIDVSASMDTPAYSKYSCMDIAMGLGMYFAEHNTGTYRDLYCTFSSKPAFDYLTGSSLYQRAYNLRRANWSGSTNLQAVFDNLLQHSLKYPLSDLPKAVIIISDMEFDEASSSQTNFEAIDTKYKAAGLERPTLIFWRVDVKEEQQPVTFDESGTILINGYSPSIMKLILSMDTEALKSITPMKLMLDAVNVDKYSFVDTIFKDRL